MNNLLRAKASRNFEKYLNDFVTKGEVNGLPASRMSDEEWKILNKELIEQGVVLVPRRHTDGYLYYWFTRANKPMDKVSVFANGKEEIENKLIEIIQKKYPTLSRANILEILRSENPLDEDMIYRKIRYKQDGQYTDVSKQEYESAFIYALQAADNKRELISMSAKHHWDPRQYENTNAFNTQIGFGGGRSIYMYGTQDWTWFRKCNGNVLPPIKDPQNPNGFHISLNVRVKAKLLSILDNILIEDGGQYIFAYKFAKTNYYESDVLSRHDSITIYTHARNPQLEQKIAHAIQPFVRSSEGLLGERLGPGISIAPETLYGNGNGLSVGAQVARDISNIIMKYGNGRL